MANKRSKSKKWPSMSEDAHKLIRELRSDEPQFANPAGLGLICHPHPELDANDYPGNLRSIPEIYKGVLFQATQQFEQKHSGSMDMGETTEELNDALRVRLGTVNRLLRDKNYRPDRISVRKSACWSVVAEILSGMPFEFRIEALDRYEEGIRVFGKLPVKTTTDAGKVVTTTVVGPARPMGCAEPPSEGAEFRLAWKEGSLWNWNLDQHHAGKNMVRAGQFRPGIAGECTKYFRFLLQLEFKRTHSQALDARTIVDLVECCEDSLANPNVATGFYAGVLFSRLFLYTEADNYYANKAGVKKSEWPDIIACALDRHGWETTNKQLLALFEGVIDDSKQANALTKENRSVTFPNWPHIPEEKLTLKKFSEKVKDVKKRRNPKDRPSDLHISRLRQLLKEYSE